MNVVVVESPAKAKTINKYLGKDYTVLASYGHIRDLPSKDGSVKPDEDFAMDYQNDAKSAKHIKAIADALKDADNLYLATDPDREGEAIAWHVLKVMEEKKKLKTAKVSRVVFNEITKKAVLDGIANPRELDMNLVNAQQARRALDYLVGFTLSPVLWRKLPGAKSAGRVQSVALRLICERELEIEAFVPEEYWTIDADFNTASGDKITARLTHLKNDKLDKFSLPNADLANAAGEAVRAGNFKVASVTKKPAKRNPSPPFTTSTLQQEASRKLGFGAKRTMMVAQKLYEGFDIGGETTGLITYMRTDGVTLANEAIDACRSVIASEYGDKFVPSSPRVYKTKSKNAQEAHEAIRPTDLSRTPAQMAQYLDKEHLRLYELIWKRTIASQMESAQLERTTVDFSDGNGQTLRATGSVIRFSGFLKLYEEGQDDEDNDKDGKRLPAVDEGEVMTTNEVREDQHFTEPAPRYSEASLVKKLEELGIGRPSTYASIISVLQDRDYVKLDQKRFIPEDKGQLVTAFLSAFFTRYVEYDFTAQLEERLDDISDAKIDWKQVLRDFWNDFTVSVEGTSELRVSDVLEELNKILGPHIFPEKEDGSDPRDCPKCDDGRLSLKTGRFGAFIGCSNYPECRYTRQLGASEEEAEAATADEGPKELGLEPDSGLMITLRNGPYGPYLQLGEAEPKKKPKRVSIPKDIPLEDVDFEMALQLISLPREIGPHPETGSMITANLGRYGPYVECDKKYGRLASGMEVLTVGMNRAVELLATAKTRGGAGRAAPPLRVVGAHPDDGADINVKDGRYGPYVTHGGINATIPKSSDPMTITLEEAVTLLAERAAKSGKKPKKAAAKKTPAKKAPAKKTAAKKTTAKKAAPKKKAASKE
ncbi:type I DNA topoisomerase [Sneathiella sp. P13V-1]|uniref:type I DNA topoisomerase n=1 Tax=Sneathiella sp. P13V-1 TaxID=2697366 RepID=UPI00187BB4FE|nr:type I DNA topoisomerase [Sneathiella sp. P13V-1]MBE7636878.1 type I DNA topoisomerase [Sneathiella sp. P13V-1]